MYNVIPNRYHVRDMSTYRGSIRDNKHCAASTKCHQVLARLLPAHPIQCHQLGQFWPWKSWIMVIFWKIKIVIFSRSNTFPPVQSLWLEPLMSFGEWALLTSLVLVGGAFVAQAINDGEGGDGEVRQGLMIRGTAQPPLYSSVCTYSTVQGGLLQGGYCCFYSLLAIV